MASALLEVNFICSNKYPSTFPCSEKIVQGTSLDIKKISRK